MVRVSPLTCSLSNGDAQGAADGTILSGMLFRLNLGSGGPRNTMETV